MSAIYTLWISAKTDFNTAGFELCILRPRTGRCWRYHRNVNYWSHSGGEAILQAEFVRDWFRACHKEGIHTCLDTNGFVRRYDPVIDELLEVTDLVMLDLKQMNDEIHQNLVGVSNHRTLEFAKYIADKGIKTWIRYVVVPGWSDDDDSAHRLGEFTRDMGNVEKIELLPYHELGKHKWVAMGEEYKLDGVKPPKKETMERVKGILEQYGHKVMY